MAMTETERAKYVRSLGLKAKGDSLAGESEPRLKAAATDGVQWAPEGVDPHTMPVDDIVFTDNMLDDFPDLSGREAADHLFAQYKSPRKDPARNKPLWNEIQKFINEVKFRRKPQQPGHVKELVNATKEQRELARYMAAQGITEADLDAVARAMREEEQA